MVAEQIFKGIETRTQVLESAFARRQIQAMSQNNRRGIGRLMARAALHTLCGGILAALLGAACIAIAGALTGAFLDIGGTPADWQQGLIPFGCFLGLYLGAWSGGLTGALIYALNAFLGAPGPRLLPRRPLVQAVSLGQIAATIGVCTSFFGAELLFSLLTHQAFSDLIDRHLMWIVCGAPALMVCGAIAGALWVSRRKNKSPRA